MTRITPLLLLSALITGLLGSESASTTDWPWFGGPHGDFSYQQPEGVQPATAAKDIRLLWESEALVGATGLSRRQLPAGGAATPIVYQDRIYLWYFTPNPSLGIDLDPRTRKVPKEFGAWSSIYRVMDNAIVGDQRIICIDAQSGITLWERHFPATGMVQNGHKDGLNNMTMAAADGRVYAFGSGRYVYALDAESGALIWRVKNSNWLGYQQTLTKHLALGRQFKRSRDGNHYLVPIEGVVVTGGNDNGASLTAFDAASGERLWSNSGWTGGRSMPKIWHHGERQYLLAAGVGKMALMDPKTGERLWEVTERISAPGPGFSVQGDLLFINHGEPKPSESSVGHLVCYRLSLSGPELLWEAPEEHGFPTAKNTGFFVHDGLVWMRSLNHVRAYDISTGEQVWVERLWGKGPVTDKDHNDDTAIVFRVNNLLYQVEDSQHSSYTTAVIDMDQRKVVGRFTIKHPGLSYSSQMLPVPWQDKLILRRSYCRISCLSFAAPQGEPPALQVEFREGIQVVATGEEALFAVEAQAGEIAAVRFLLDGKEAAVDSEAPFEFRQAFDSRGARQLQAIATDANGNEAATSSRLISVVDWEVRLLPERLTMTVGGKRRFIPVVFDPVTGHQLPQRFQALQMGQFLDTAYPTPFASFTKEHHREWHERAEWVVSGGSIETAPDPANSKSPYHKWGTYTAATAGTHTLTVRYTHAGVTKEASAVAVVSEAGQQQPQRITRLAPLPTYRVDSGSIRQMIAVLDSGLSHEKVRWSLVSGPATQRKPGEARFSSTGPGWVVIEGQHPGDDRFAASEPIQQRVLVIPKHAERQEHTITFAAIADHQIGSGPIELRATSPSSEPVQFSVISGPARVEGQLLVLTGAPGVVSVVAEHRGDLSYAPATPLLREFRVTE